MQRILRGAILALFALTCAFGQPATPVSELQAVTLPQYIFGGISYNQFGSPVFAGVISALEPESQSIGLLASESVDLQPVQYTDPKTGKAGYVLAASARFGQHKILLNTATPQPAGVFKPSFVLALGGDAGASFSNSIAVAGSPSTISVGFSGSFTLSAFYRFKPHWAAGLAVRALYLSGVGPNGSGAINPVVEPGVVYCR
jgi:hypothetical protein